MIDNRLDASNISNESSNNNAIDFNRFSFILHKVQFVFTVLFGA